MSISSEEADLLSKLITFHKSGISSEIFNKGN